MNKKVLVSKKFMSFERPLPNPLLKREGTFLPLKRKVTRSFLDPFFPAEINQWSNKESEQNNTDHNKAGGSSGKRQYIGIHPIHTGNQHGWREHTWQDRESTNRIVLLSVNESGGGIEQESNLLEQERIMFYQGTHIFTQLSNIG